ncbi:unnamed protein product [Gongylonema pulchrum]|uniref:Uncharacterized protein n=1 Tax=Gongylonema pulchrum TaxID=637853 RepID=A0A183DWB9_9BILA|nr:unnamed protein product [Gongylonema pulchrum]
MLVSLHQVKREPEDPSLLAPVAKCNETSSTVPLDLRSGKTELKQQQQQQQLSNALVLEPTRNTTAETGVSSSGAAFVLDTRFYACWRNFSAPLTIFAPATGVPASAATVFTPITEMVRILQQAQMFSSQRQNGVSSAQQRNFNLLQLMQQEQSDAGK